MNSCRLPAPPEQPGRLRPLLFSLLLPLLAPLSLCSPGFAAAQTADQTPAATPQLKTRQQRWQWQVLPPSNAVPWPQAFAFSEILPVNETTLPGRWLSLTPRDESWMPAFYDTVDQRLVSLAPGAQTLCNGVTVDRVVKALHARSSGLTVDVRYTMQFANGTSRRSGGPGELDANGQWSRYPFGTTMPRPDGCPVTSEVSPSPPPIAMDVPASHAQARLEVVSVLGQPALRDTLTGRWMTPQPSQDPVIAQWQTHRLTAFEGTVPGGFGLIDAAGRMAVPMLFGSLTDVRPNATLDAELIREGNLRHQETPRLRLPAASSFAKGYRTAQGENGKWGYVDAHGRWVIAAQYEKARPFVNGYAVVSGNLPAGWTPPGAPPELQQRALVRSIMRLGDAWVISIAAPAGTGDGRLAVGRAVMDAQGRWLVPVASPAAD